MLLYAVYCLNTRKSLTQWPTCGHWSVWHYTRLQYCTGNLNQELNGTVKACTLRLYCNGKDN